MRPFGVFCISRMTIGQCFSFSDQTSFLEVQLLHPYGTLGRPCALKIPAIACIITASVLIKKKRRVNAGSIFQPHRIRPGTGRILGCHVEIATTAMSCGDKIECSIMITQSGGPDAVIIRHTVKVDSLGIG